MAIILAVGVLAVACGEEETATTTAPPGTETTAPASTETTAPASTESTAAPSGEPIRIGYNEGFTGFMAYDCELAERGIQTAFAMLDNQILGRPIEYFPEDNTSDPVVAVDKARKQVESDGINVMIGPIFSPVGQGCGRLPGQVQRHTADVHRGAAHGECGNGQQPSLHPYRASSTPTGTTSASSWRRRASRPPTSSTTMTPPPTH